MLESLRRGRRWGAGAVVLLVGGVFVAYIGLGGPMQCTQTAAVVEVAGHAYYRDDFLRAQNEREQAFRRLAGDAFDASGAKDFLQAAAAQTLVSRAILAGEAERVGLGISKDELRSVVRSDPGFRDSTGSFDPELYKRYIAYEYGTEGHFLEILEGELLATKMIRLIASTAHVSEAEARQAALHRMQELRAAFVVFDPSLAANPQALGDEEVAAFAAASPERIQTLYNERLDQYDQPEGIRARHILIRVTPGADPAQVEQARVRAEETLERLRGGADFVDVALEVSEDPGSKSKGGDLGFFGRGVMTPAFEEAAFAAEPGVLVGPIQTDFGFHLILVEERREARKQSVDEVSATLARELLAQDRGAEVAREKAERLRDAIQEGASLEAAARQQALTVERTGWLRRRADGFVPGLGGSTPLLDTAFAMQAGSSSPRVFEVDGKLALIAVLERRQPKPDELATAMDQEREEMLENRRNRVVEDWIQAERRTLEAEGRIHINLANVEGP